MSGFSPVRCEIVGINADGSLFPVSFGPPGGGTAVLQSGVYADTELANDTPAFQPILAQASSDSFLGNANTFLLGTAAAGFVYDDISNQYVQLRVANSNCIAVGPAVLVAPLADTSAFSAVTGMGTTASITVAAVAGKCVVLTSVVATQYGLGTLGTNAVRVIDGANQIAQFMVPATAVALTTGTATVTGLNVAGTVSNAMTVTFGTAIGSTEGQCLSVTYKYV